MDYPSVICTHCSKVLKKGTDGVKWFTCKDCREELRDDHPLREVVYQAIGHRLAGSRHSGYDKYYCPWHPDIHEASLWVSDSVLSCEAGCAINGRRYGDVYDFVAQFYALSFQDAAEFLSGRIHPDMPSVPARSQPAAPQHPLTMEQVLRLHLNAEQAMHWFKTRGLSSMSVDSMLLGMLQSRTHSYEFKTGTRKGEVIQATTRHYSVPNVFYNRVFYCKLRRDDGYSMDQLRLMEQRTVQAVRDDLEALQGREVSDHDVMEALFTRYPQLSGPMDARAVFNAQTTVRPTPRGPEYLHADYRLIHEGEFKAMAMSEAGYPSLSNVRDERIARVLQNVKRKIYVRDPGEAGERVALQHKVWIPDLEIIQAPDGFKAADDLITGGGDVHKWMSSLGLEPTLGPR